MTKYYLNADLFDGVENDVEVLKTNTHGVVFEMGQSLSAHIVHQTTVNYCISLSHYLDQATNNDTYFYPHKKIILV